MTNSRQKGKRGERMAAAKLKVLGICQEARRTQQYCGYQEGDADLKTDIDGIHFEVKFVERLNIHNALKQAQRDKMEEESSVVLHKKNREPWVIACYLDDWLTITKLLGEHND